MKLLLKFFGILFICFSSQIFACSDVRKNLDFSVLSYDKSNLYNLKYAIANNNYEQVLKIINSLKSDLKIEIFKSLLDENENYFKQVFKINKLTGKLHNYNKPVKNIALSENGKFALLYYEKDEIFLLDLTDLTDIREYKLKGFIPELIAINHDGTLAITGSFQPTRQVNLWDLRDLNKPLKPILIDLAENRKIISVEFCKNKNDFIIVTLDKAIIHFYDLEFLNDKEIKASNEKMIRSNIEPVKAIRGGNFNYIKLSNDHISLLFNKKTIREFKLSGPNFISPSKIKYEPDNITTNDIDISNDGNVSITTYANKKSKKEIEPARIAIFNQTENQTFFINDKEKITCARLTGDGAKALTGSTTGINLWDISSPEIISTKNLHSTKSKVTKISSSNDCKTFIYMVEKGDSPYFFTNSKEIISTLNIGLDVNLQQLIFLLMMENDKKYTENQAKYYKVLEQHIKNLDYNSKLNIIKNLAILYLKRNNDIEDCGESDSLEIISDYID